MLQLFLLLQSNQLILAGSLLLECDDPSFQPLDRALAPLGLGTLLAVLVLQNGEFLLILLLHGGKLSIELNVQVIQGLLTNLGFPLVS